MICSICYGWCCLLAMWQCYGPFIMRDTAAFWSFNLDGVLSFSKESTLGSDVPVKDLGMSDIGVPLLKVFVESELVTIDFFHGGKVLVTPDVTPVLVKRSPDMLA